MTISNNGFFRAQRGVLRCICLGDSITQNDSAQGAAGLWRMGNGYAETVMRDLGASFKMPLQFVRNAGIAGNTTPQMLARLQTDVLAYAPDVVLLMCGTNDIVAGQTNAQYQTWLSALEKIIVRCLQAGIEVILATPPTKNSGSAEMRHAIPWLYDLAKFYGLRLIDAFRATVDPLSGQYKTGYSDDGTHPNQTGIAAILAETQNSWASAAGTHAVYRAAVAETSSAQPANMFQNGNFQSQVGTPNVPDYWNPNLTNATGMIDSAGYHYTKTVAGGVYALYAASVSSGYSDGDTLVFSGKLTVGGLPASPSGYSLILDMNGDSIQPFSSHVVNGTYEFSQEFVVPVGYGNGTTHPITAQLYVQDIGAYTAAEFTLWNRSAYEAVWKPGLSLLS